MLPNLNPDFHHPYLPETQSYLTKFSLLGYRTLVFGERYFSEQEFKTIEEKYKKAIVSENRKQNIKDLGMEIEKDLTLLGATAVEDALQLRVKETITRLLQAEIKVWMITGDKLETAENIGLMAGIVTHEMKTFYIKDVNKDNFYTKGKKLRERVQNYANSGDKQIAVVFDMRSVGKFSPALAIN
jgi:phospholipid-transporting ATPase